MLSEHVLIVSFKTKTTKKSRLNVYFFYEMKNIGFQASPEHVKFDLRRGSKQTINLLVVMGH